MFTSDLSPKLVSGWGVRPGDWQIGVSVQQQLLPRVSVEVGYNRRWLTNFNNVDNATNTAADFTQFSVTAPPTRGCRAAAATWCRTSTTSTRTWRRCRTT